MMNPESNRLPNGSSEIKIHVPMDPRHKNKALVGLAVWAIVLPLAIGVLVWSGRRPHLYDRAQSSFPMALWGVLTVIQYGAYFWGGSHLAKAKGYSNSLLIFGIFPPAQLVIIPLLLFGLPDKCSGRYGSGSGGRRARDESPIARIIRYRRNALIYNCVGVLGILIALMFVFLPAGLFDSIDNARVTAIFVFLPSYAAVIFGSWWWVRAKNWPDAVILIGLAPLAVLVIRYVRLIYQVAPLLLPAGMVLMPILLLGVIAALPDRSGLPKRRRRHSN